MLTVRINNVFRHLVYTLVNQFKVTDSFTPYVINTKLIAVDRLAPAFRISDD